jgi:predicted acylesterase/phospholipase RssA
MNRNGSRTLCVFKVHYRDYRAPVGNHRRFTQIQFSDHTGYALVANPPKTPGVCDNDGSRLAVVEAALPEHSEAWRTLRALVGDAIPALRAIGIGKVGLALSGGGFRASLFHVGVLARLAELDVLRHVEVLSCVSGGSITGAHYYLEVRHLLQTKADWDIQREDYIAIVQRIERDLLGAVQKNLRTRLFANPWWNLCSLVLPGYTRTKLVGDLLENLVFNQVPDGEGPRRWMDDLAIRPTGAPDFNPKLDNWRRAAKAPILLLNATTLNTGHNWQFAVSWMGEPPPPSTNAVDRNDVLRRMYYWEAPGKYRKIRLGTAVAASACVPALFDPIEFPNLYPKRIVRLVDGGVHDNQGVAGLLEQECTVVLVSDASGQMNTENRPSAEISSVPLRSNDMLMARVREGQFRELEALDRSAALNGLLFLHLKKDLAMENIDWVDSQDTYESSDDPRLGEVRGTVTSYGMPRNIQEYLAGLRTDLDSFNDREAYALMLSGYQMAEHEFRKCLPQFPVEGDAREQWRCLAIQNSVSRERDYESDYELLVRLLKAGASRSFKIWRIFPWAGWLASLLLAAGAAWAALRWRDWLGTAGWTLLAFAGLSAALWAIHRLPFSRKSLTVIVTGLLAVTIGWPLALLHLVVFDPIYLLTGSMVKPGAWRRALRPVLLAIAALSAGGVAWYRSRPPVFVQPAVQARSEMLFNLGREFMTRGNYTAAVEDFTQAIEFGGAGNAELLRDRAYAYKLLDRLEESRQDLLGAQRIQPDDRTQADLQYLGKLLQPGPRLPARLYIQVATSAQADQIAALRLAIRTPTLLVPPVVTRSAVPNRSEIRYTHAEDAREAQDLTNQLARLGLDLAEPKQVPGNTRPRHFELWLSKDAAVPVLK